jgi:beta-galactosidase
VAPSGASRGSAASGAVGPISLHGSFTLDAPADLFLDTDGWSRGFVFVNGFFLGRYSRVGPQRTLYVPGPLTRSGDNDLVVLELSHTTSTEARFVPGPLLGHLEE